MKVSYEGISLCTVVKSLTYYIETPNPPPQNTLKFVAVMELNAVDMVYNH